MIQKAHFILDVVWGCMRFILIYMCPISLVLRIWGYHTWVMLHTIGTQTNRLAPWYPICWLLITTIDPSWEWFRHTETKTYAHSLPQASHICPQWSVNRAPYIFPVNRHMSHLPLKCHLWSIHFQTRCAHRPGHVLIAPPAEGQRVGGACRRCHTEERCRESQPRGVRHLGAHESWRRQGEK